MDNVNFYNNDIAEIADLNRLSSFPQAHQERFLEALTVGRRSVSINGIVPSILAQAAPNITIRIPAQYFAVEGRIGFLPQTDVLVVHPSPSTSYDFYIYVMLRLDDDVDNRTNVNPATFVQTVNARIVAALEVSESSILNVIAGGLQPTPPTGTGVPGPGSERLGYVLRATFTWDGTAAVPAIIDNAADNIRFGSAGIIPHGLTHATTDPIPYPTNSNRGMGPPRTLPYWKNSISRVEPAAGSPITAAPIGSNGPAGDTNYDIYNPATAKGFELDFDFDGGSYQLVGTTFTPRFAAPPSGGTAGSALTHARSDHGHMALLSQPVYKKHDNAGYTAISALTAVYTAVPTAVSAIPSFGGYANRIGILQVDLHADGPDVGTPENALQFKIIGGGGMERWVTVEASANGDRVAQTTTIVILLDATGSVSIQGFNTSTALYRISLVGTFGQGV